MKRWVVVIALAATPLLADDVYLRGGGQLTGEIVERSEESVEIDIGGGTLTVRMSSVVRIEENVSPLQEYRARAEGVPAGDAEAWRQLARWATSRALATQASQAYSRVVAILPDDPEANRALGRVQVGGTWVTEEESYRSRGYVEFEGEWMTPSERQTILAERTAQEEADRLANEAEIRSIQAEIAAEKRQEAQEAEAWARRYNNLPKYGDPISWGWGAGPGSWPQTPAGSSAGGQQ